MSFREDAMPARSTFAEELARGRRLLARLIHPEFLKANALFWARLFLGIEKLRGRLDTAQLHQIVAARFQRFIARYGALPFWDLVSEARVGSRREALVLAAGRIGLVVVFPWTTEAMIQAQLGPIRARLGDPPRGAADEAALAMWLAAHRLSKRVIDTLLQAHGPRARRHAPTTNPAIRRERERDAVRNMLRRHLAEGSEALARLEQPLTLDPFTEAVRTLVRRDASASEVDRARRVFRRGLIQLGQTTR
jgi:hypothetical protein